MVSCRGRLRRMMRKAAESVTRTLHGGSVRQYVAAATAALSAMMCGSAFSWVTQILVSLTGPDSEVPMSREQSSWMVSFIEVGNLFTPLPAGLLVDRWGRWLCLLLSAPLSILSWLMVLTTRSVTALYVVRFIQGIASGVIFTVLPLYLGEVSEPRLRGSLSTLFEVMWYSGALLQYCVAPYVSYQALAYMSLAVPVVFFMSFLTMPETPYFLLMTGQEQRAADTLLWLRGGESSRRSVEAELKAMKASVESDLSEKSSSSWIDLVNSPVDRRCLMIVLVVTLLEVICGIPAILAYVTEALSNTKGQSFLKADQYTMLMGVANLVSTIVSSATVDRLGRRPILLTSCLGAAICQFFTGLYFYIDDRTDIDVSGYSWVAFLTISCYSVLLCGGAGALSTTIAGELFPSHTRGLGNGVTTMSFNLGCFLCLKLYQDVEDAVGVFLNFWMYSAFGLLGALFIHLYLPETKGKSFAEIRQHMEELTTHSLTHPDITDNKVAKLV